MQILRVTTHFIFDFFLGKIDQKNWEYLWTSYSWSYLEVFVVYAKTILEAGSLRHTTIHASSILRIWWSSWIRDFQGDIELGHIVALLLLPKLDSALPSPEVHAAYLIRILSYWHRFNQNLILPQDLIQISFHIIKYCLVGLIFNVDHIIIVLYQRQALMIDIFLLLWQNRLDFIAAFLNWWFEYVG